MHALETGNRTAPFARGSASSKRSTEVPIDGTKISPKRFRLQAESLRCSPKDLKCGRFDGGCSNMPGFFFLHTFIRVALGAQSGDVLGMVAKTGLRLALIGVAAGALLALGVTRAIASVLYDVKPWDPMTYAAVGVALTTVALLACFIPARRATKVDPITALRYE